MVEVELLNWSGKESVKLVVDAVKMTADSLGEQMDDEEILRMLVENDYMSAIEHIWFTFRIKCSIGCQRQILEHRIASHTTKSTRYCDENVLNSFVEIPGLSIDDRTMINEYLKIVNDVYENLKDRYGRDIARYVLPIGLMTEFVWTVNARSLINFLGLRLCDRSHWEIRMVASEIIDIVRELVPEIFERIWCRGVNMGVCPENEARPKKCMWRKIIPTKKEVKMQKG